MPFFDWFALQNSRMKQQKTRLYAKLLLLRFHWVTGCVTFISTDGQRRPGYSTLFVDVHRGIIQQNYNYISHGHLTINVPCSLFT